MKVLVLLAIVAACAQAGTPQVRDWSKIRPRYPEYVKDFKPSLPTHSEPLRRGTQDLRAVCGQPNRRAIDSHIVGGVVADVNEFPWQVAVFIDGQSFCGGSLLNEEWILTAAHCAINANYFDVMLGAHNVRLTSEPTRQEYRATSAIVHPNYNPNTLRDDIALIRLPQPITFNDYIRPICLPTLSESDHAGDPVTVTGWGRPSDSVSSISPELRKTNTTVITNTECRSVYGSIITSSNICTSVAEGHGTCNGDSGGPLSFVQSDGTFRQVGVVSFVSSAGCESGYPDGFTRLSSFLEWVSSNTGISIN